MTAQEFLDLSTKRVGDLQAWVREAANDSSISPGELETLRAATQIVERVTLREVNTKAKADPPGHIIL